MGICGCTCVHVHILFICLHLHILYPSMWLSEWLQPLFLVPYLCPGQVQFCHRDQVAAAAPSVSVAARGDTPSAKWISLIGWVIY